METIYVAHAYEGESENLEAAKRIMRILQTIDTKSVYICPLIAFSFLEYNALGYDTEMSLCLQLLSRCDRLVVSGNKISTGVRQEILYAQEHKIPIEYIDDNLGDID